MSKDNHILIIWAQNKPGVLNKILSLCRRRRYNIEALTAGTTHVPNVSHITLVLSGLHEGRASQVAEQISKIIEVVSVDVVEQKDVVDRELFVMIGKSREIYEKLEGQTARDIDVKLLNEVDGKPVIQVTGPGLEIEQVIEELDMEKDVEKLVRTGLVGVII